METNTDLQGKLRMILELKEREIKMSESIEGPSYGSSLKFRKIKHEEIQIMVIKLQRT